MTGAATAALCEILFAILFPLRSTFWMDGSSAHSKRMVHSRDAMTTRQAKLVTFVIGVMTNVTNGVAQSGATLLTWTTAYALAINDGGSA
jgi:hypothetical protein